MVGKRALGISSAAGVVFLLSLVALPVYAQTYALSLQTNATTYTGTSPIVITGAITPAPGPNTGVVITIRNPSSSIADIDEAQVQTNGSYSWTSIPGGNSNWVTGTYSVNATWGSSTGALSQVVTFSYTAATSTTTTTTTSVVNTSGTSSTVAEFPNSALAVVALVALALTAVASRRFEGRGLPVSTR